MASGYKWIFAGHRKKRQHFSAVADTASAVTYDLEDNKVVVIVADAPTPPSVTFLPRLNLLGVG